MKKKNLTTICMFVLFISVLSSALGGCSSVPESEALEMTGIYFDTVVQIRAWGTTQSVLDECQNICEKYENMFSTEIADSEIAQINTANGEPVEVSGETAELIRTALDYCELSGGKFDITIAPLSRLWNFGSEQSGVIPDADAISEACSHIDYHLVELDGNTVTLADPQAQIDLGGIAKGYIADRLKEYLTSEGVEHALINLGGNTVAVGERYDGDPFRIGIQKPFAESGETIDTIEIVDRSVVSSGNYQRYFEQDGTIYHHILDPETGYPYQNDLYQVTIISDHSVDGDALSTTCFALGLEEGSRLIENLENVSAIFITSDYELHYVGFDE